MEESGSDVNATPRFVQATVTQRPRLSTAAATFSVAQGDRHFSGEGNLTPDISSDSVPLGLCGGGGGGGGGGAGGAGGAADVTLDESSAFICVFIFRLSSTSSALSCLPSN